MHPHKAPTAKRCAALIVLFVASLVRLLGDETKTSTAPQSKDRTGTAPDKTLELRERFEREIWPILNTKRSRARGKGSAESCVSCHDDEHSSDLRLVTTASASFDFLLAKGYFSSNGGASLIERVTTEKRNRLMPPSKFKQLDSKEVSKLREFVASAAAAKIEIHRDDQSFPAELETEWTGEVPEGIDNTFISYWQLRAKVRSIFGDDWKRNGRDLFEENIALFGGANFRTRFDEDSNASATFFSALDTMARDVTTRAFETRRGPYLDLPTDLAPVGEETRDLYLRGIRRLYEQILFRPPSATEEKDSFNMLTRIFALDEVLRKREHTVEVELLLRDPETKLETRAIAAVAIRGDGLGVHSTSIDQRSGDKRQGKNVARLLDSSYRWQPKQSGQELILYNRDSDGLVSFAGLELIPAEQAEQAEQAENAITITADSPLVQLEGAWKRSDDHYHDENFNKGGSSVRVDLNPERTGATRGEYRIAVLFKLDDENASTVDVDVVHAGASRLTPRPTAPAPPKGEAHYFIDQREDTIAFKRLEDRFRFAKTDYVEINNTGTRRRVTADAVRFDSDAKSFLVDNHEADNQKGWKKFSSGMFGAYNRVGPDTFHDENKNKGKLHLRYRPAVKKGWESSRYYEPAIGYPAKRDHEIRTPVIVRAQSSSPIARVVYPRSSSVGTRIAVDASSSFTIQHSKLIFEWRQASGAKIDLQVSEDGRSVSFLAPASDVNTIAWTALARGLLFHPDFLFTRPPSVSESSPDIARRLSLVKIALDLVGRPPNATELESLETEGSLETLVDAYLSSEDFAEYYFHRIRLYLETHGTPEQDEPARLWTWIALNDRPFQEILTANYTADENLKRTDRGKQHGKTGILTTAGFIAGKPGLPHFNYAALVAEKFLGYVFEISPEIEAERALTTAASTVDPQSSCYSCHKILTPLANQRLRWTDKGQYRSKHSDGSPVDDSDKGVVANYPFAGQGMEAFATQATRTERFIRTMINIHFVFYFGRELRHEQDERVLYRRLWDATHQDGFALRKLIRAIVLSPEYLTGRAQGNPAVGKD